MEVDNFDWMEHHLRFGRVSGKDRKILPEVRQEVLDYLNAHSLSRICVLDDSSTEVEGWFFFRFLHQDGTYHCRGHRCAILQVRGAYHPIMRPSGN